MNTNQRSLQLRSGQALAVDLHGSATLFLAEGEVLVQAPAQWLGDTVFQPPARRIAAPAALPGREIGSVTALGPAQLHLAQAAGPLEKLASAWRSMRMATGFSARRPARG